MGTKKMQMLSEFAIGYQHLYHHIFREFVVLFYSLDFSSA